MADFGLRTATTPLPTAADKRDGRFTLVVQETEEKPIEKQQTIADFLTQAMARYRVAADASATRRKNQLDDYEFRSGETQWDPVAKSERSQEGKPCLTINRIPQFIRQVTNSQRNQNLAIKISPVDDHADIKVAEVFQGMIRNIEQQSDASTAYATASEHQVTFGLGYWRILTEYQDDDSFLQEIKIKRIRNPFTVYFDPAAHEADLSDARYCFIVEDVPRDEFRSRYGDEAFASLSEMQSIGDNMAEWAPDNAVRIAEYWYVEETPEILFLIETSDGGQDTIFEDEFKAVAEAAVKAGVAPPKILRKRTAKRRRVYQTVICKTTILVGNDDNTSGRLWPGKYIPVVALVGDELDINGKVDYRGMVRDAKDSQRIYNFQNTSMIETIALAPRAPFVGYLGQFEGLEKKWETANRKNWAYLEVNPVTANGQIAPLPQRQTAEPAIAAISQAIAQADNDLKATMGLFDPSLGARGPQQSGKAIQALKQQGELANSNFIDNLNRSLRYTGKILIDLIPKIYDAPRVVRYIGLDEEQKTAIIHTGRSDEAQKLSEFYKESGIAGIYDLNAGRMDVVVSSGPSTQSKRQEAAAALNELIQSAPQFLAPLISDLLVKNLDFPESQAAAERLKRAVPPQFKDPEEGAPAVPPEVQQQMAQKEMENQQLKAGLAEAQSIIQGQTIEAELKKLELASKERIALLNARIKLLDREMQEKGDTSRTILEAEVTKHQMANEKAHEAGMEAVRQHHDNTNKTLDRADKRELAAAGSSRKPGDSGS